MRNDLKPYNMLVLLIISAKKYTSNPSVQKTKKRLWQLLKVSTSIRRGAFI